MVVIRDPERVSVTELLTDGRWRETAVTILQTQSAAAIAPLLDEATQLLAPMTHKALEDQELQAASGGYCWPPGSMHLLGVLNAGLGQAPDSISAEFRTDAGSLLISAWNNGRRHDRKWAVSLALVANKENTVRLLEQAFASGSVVLGGAAYACVSRMADPPPSLYDGVRRTLVEMAASGDLPEQRLALGAQIRRLPKPLPLIQTLRLLTIAPRVDYGLAAILVSICIPLVWPISILEGVFVALGLTGHQLMLSRHVPYRIRGTRLVISPYSYVALGVVLYARVFAAALAIIVVDLPGLPRAWPITATAIIAAVFFVTWPASVGYVCRNRRGINGFLWPCVPLLALAGVTRKAMNEIRKLSVSALSAALLVIAFYGILLWAGIVYLTPILRNAKDLHIVDIVAISIFSVLVISLSCAYGIYLSRRASDRRLVRRFFSLGQQLSATEIFGALDQIKTSRGMSLFIESALRINLLANPEMIRILSDIAAAAEVAEARRKASAEEKKKERKKRKAKEPIVVPGVTPEFADWLKAHAEKKGRAMNKGSTARLPIAVRNLPSASLDQIARSIEQVELARGFVSL